MLPVRTLLFGWSHIFTHLDDGAQLYSGQNLLGFQVMARWQSMWLEVWGTDSLTHRGSFPALLPQPIVLPLDRHVQHRLAVGLVGQPGHLMHD